MTVALDLLFLLSVLGMFVSYPVYFLLLHRFQRSLQLFHPSCWRDFSESAEKEGAVAAYAALEAAKCGTLNGVILAPEVRLARRRAVVALYVAAGSFMTFLFSGLATLP